VSGLRITRFFWWFCFVAGLFFAIYSVAGLISPFSRLSFFEIGGLLFSGVGMAFASILQLSKLDARKPISGKYSKIQPSPNQPSETTPEGVPPR
jgi:hypothetical protein